MTEEWPGEVGTFHWLDLNIETCRVVTSDGAVVVLTGKGDVVALTEYSTRKLGQRQHNVAKLEVSQHH